MNSVERLRSAAEVAGRLVILASTCVVAQERSGQGAVVTWLKSQGIWSAASPSERAFLEARSASPGDEIAFSWNAEPVYFLGWALGLTAVDRPFASLVLAGRAWPPDDVRQAGELSAWSTTGMHLPSTRPACTTSVAPRAFFHFRNGKRRGNYREMPGVTWCATAKQPIL